MPTYEYECSSCGHTFEAFQSMSDAPLSACPECGKAVKRRIFGGTGVIFKGSGFYVNDSRKKSSAGAAKTPSAPEKEGASKDGPAKDSPSKGATPPAPDKARESA